MSFALKLASQLPRGEVSPHVQALQYETISGSHAYGVAGDDSDYDVVGFCIPPKEVLFPHLAGEIPGFGRQKSGFGQWIVHHQKVDGKPCDVTVYNIVKFFQLAMENNPNMIELLFTPDSLVTHRTKISDHVRNNRRLFLHKGSYHAFRGFAYSQVKKLQTKDKDWHRLHKFAYHCVRLLLGAKQILREGDLQLDKYKDVLTSVREGKWETDDVVDFFRRQEVILDELYKTSTIPHSPDQEAIKKVLLDCLEEFYGDISDCVRRK